MTILLTHIPAHFQAADLRAVHRLIYSGQISRPQIASLAVIVGAAAQAGDPAAQSILRQAGAQLGTAAAAVIHRLEMQTADLPVYTSGGVFAAGDLVLTALRETVTQVSPASRVQPARYPQIVGALLLALTALDIPVQPLLNNIETTLPVQAVDKHKQREDSA